MKIIVSPGPTFSSNPFFQLLNRELTKLGDVLAAPGIHSLFWADIYHVNFPEHMVSEQKNIFSAVAKASAMLGIMFIQVLRGCPIVWTVHDVRPLRSNHPKLSSLYMTCVRKMIDGYIFISKSSLQKYKEYYPQECYKLKLEAFHPFFPHSSTQAKDKISLRKAMGLQLDDFVIGYLGDIKPYKNPDILKHIPSKLDDGRDIILLVAGKADGAVSDFETEIAGRPIIRINKRLDNDELESMIRTVDVVFLPYLWGWNSGFLFLVLAQAQRALVSNLPIFMEMKELLGDYWVTTFDLSAEDKAQELSRAVNSLSQKKCTDTELASLARHMKLSTFQQLATDIQNFYVTLKSKTK